MFVFADPLVDANENSEAQVEGLVREFTAFHHCLVEAICRESHRQEDEFYQDGVHDQVHGQRERNRWSAQADLRTLPGLADVHLVFAAV